MIPGERTNLRAMERSDVPVVHRWLNAPEALRGWGDTVAAVSQQEVARRVEGWLAEEATRNRPAAFVVETLAGEPVGLVVVADDRPEARSVELSLLLDPAHWGHGYGSDALVTILDACFSAWNLHRVTLHCEAGNDRARRLYAKLGFEEEGTMREAAFIDGAYADVLVLSLLAEAWTAPDRAAEVRS